MYARILLATDGSDRSLAVRAVAERAATAWGCGLRAVHVPAAEDPSPWELPDVELLPGPDPAAGLVDAVHATDPPGLLCLSTRGRGAVGELVFGSVAATVVREVHAPTLTVGPSVVLPPSGPWRRVLVCLDGSDVSAQILPTVRRWASELGLAVHLLHVAYPLGDPRIGDLHLPEETRAVAAQLHRTAQDLAEAGIDASWSVAEDTEVPGGIVRQAVELSCDLIALCTHGRTALGRVVAGSVALPVVRRATVPTLVLRPADLR